MSYTVSKLGQYCSKCPSSVYRDGLRTLAYLARTSHLQLRYGSFDEPWGGQEPLRYARSRCTVEGWSDASFGQDDGGRSHTGILLVIAGGAVSWHSSRQTLTALSTAESEIIAAVDNMVLAESIDSPLGGDVSARSAVESGHRQFCMHPAAYHSRRSLADETPQITCETLS